MVLVGEVAFIALAISTLLLCLLLFLNIKVEKKKQINWFFIGILVCLLICCIGQMLSIAVPKFTGIEPVYFDYIVYVGTCFLPLAFLFFGISFSKTRIKFNLKYLLLFIIPVISLLVLWTNDLHHLFYVKYAIINKDTIFGSYFPIHSFYSYLLILIGVFYLIASSIKSAGFFSRQSYF